MADQRKKPNLDADVVAPRIGDEGARGIVGIVGESSDPDLIRLFLDLTFRKRYEIPRDAILRRESIAAAQSPFGIDASVVFVRPGTVLQIQLTEARTVEQEFVAGDFTSPGSFRPSGVSGGAGALLISRFCDASDFRCPTEFQTHCPTCRTPCPSVDIPCGGTNTFQCSTEMCPTSGFCLSQDPRIC